MKPDPDFGTGSPNFMLPETQLWRAVLFRAVLDAQHGSQGMMRDVLRWIDTKDFERVVVWAGFELEQGRLAAKYLRDVCAERSAQIATAATHSLVDEPEFDVTDPDGDAFDEALLALISTARDITEARRAACPRGPRRPSLRSSVGMASPAPL
jgi:hypothetical protein